MGKGGERGGEEKGKYFVLSLIDFLFCFVLLSFLNKKDHHLFK